MSEYVLHQIYFSHFNEKGRWALDYKGVPHRRKTVPPGQHRFHSRRLGGGGTLPVLVVNGETFPGSDRIIAELERLHPEPALYPAGEDDRQRALELESWMGEELGPQVRSALFSDLLPETALCRRVIGQGLGGPTRALQFVTFPVARPLVRRSLRADAEAGARGREKTVAAMDRIEAELRPSGYLASDDFSVADLTAAALLAPLVGPPQFQAEWPDPWPERWEEFRSEHRGRPAWRYTEEIFARHRGESTEVR